ncbi:hypothetical protein [Polynucleobacter sp. UK-Kesae-W10]|uniref:hypothetical protein n=1 Tax=Polynucleobacter sp. UK-Kesae-W10 TaxID=1819738 RepID=UPI001C0E45E1|nr:hypothetical protein [Polynucleobacter sp. UK-Kesae-W10]MBU3577545.1 hypothetical protein [Polynucleobacter sp. UK-Kesae-W10]
MTDEVLKASKRDARGGLFRIKIRALLRKFPEGMTLKEINHVIQGKSLSIYRAIKRMPDVYCSHWVEPHGEKAQAVYKAVHVPDDCPRPAKKPINAEQRRLYLANYRQKKKDGALLLTKNKKPRADTSNRITHLSKEEAEARDAAFIQRYSNPPTYKPLK